MTTSKQYFDALLESQKLTDEDDEIAELKEQRKVVEDILRDKFWSDPIIRYAWSYSKDTMIKELYDLDIIVYFKREEDWDERTLEEIFFAVGDALWDRYKIKYKTSAISLIYDKDDKKDVHIDVVPWRFIEWSNGDAYIYQNDSDKCRLKTNLDTHIEHIRESKEHSAIRLIKLLKVKNAFDIKTFFLELFVIKALESSKNTHIENKLMEVFQYIVDNIETLKLEDPANTNNIISDQVSPSEKERMKDLAQDIISTRNTLIDDEETVSFWGTIFWEVEIKKTYSTPNNIKHTPSPWAY